MENILLNLSTRQIFGVRRTHKAFFHDTIEGSVKLQRAMFLLPDPGLADKEPEFQHLNPLLRELAFLFVPSQEVSECRFKGIKVTSTMIHGGHPDTFHAASTFIVKSDITVEEPVIKLPVEISRHHHDDRNGKPVTPSWQKTVITSMEPRGPLEVEMEWNVRRWQSSSVCSLVWEPDGKDALTSVLLGMVIDSAAHLVRMHPSLDSYYDDDG